MHALVITVGVLNSVSLAVLAVVAVRLWITHRSRAAGWLALAFTAIGLLVTIGRLVAVRTRTAPLEYLGQRVDIELLVLFPFLVYRFATTFVPPGLFLRRLVPTLTIGLTVFTFALPHIPAVRGELVAAFAVYVIAFFVHWTLLSISVTVRLLVAGRGQPSVSAKRMHMLAFAAATLTIALLGTTFANDQSSPGALVVQLIGFASIVGFYLGIDPPRIVRAYWRMPEQTRLQEAWRGLVTLAVDRPEIAARIAAPAAELVGARGLLVIDGAGNELASWGTVDRDRVVIEEEGVTFVASTSPYAPFFGQDELRTLHTIAGLDGDCARPRTPLRAGARDAARARTRERADDELRRARRARAADAGHDDPRIRPDAQPRRRAALGGAEGRAPRSARAADAPNGRARRAAPRPFAARRGSGRRAAAGRRARATTPPGRCRRGARAPRSRSRSNVPENASAHVDPQILDHVVTNLVTNAFRYGRAPVRVTATAENGRLRVAVEDSGPGVAREIEETLFDRFTRAGVARDRVAGAGLGLAIARAYAQAHRGDLRYERGDPTGARFVVDLPAI